MRHLNKFNEEIKTYFRCECGSDTFIRVYNVWNEKIKAEVSIQNGEEYWGVE